YINNCIFENRKIWDPQPMYYYLYYYKQPGFICNYSTGYPLPHGSLTLDDVLFKNYSSVNSYYGINCFTTGDILINNCKFSGLDKGIIMYNSHNHISVKNSVFTGIPSAQDYNEDTYGIFAISARDFEISGNSFDGFSSGVNDLNEPASYGIVIENANTYGCDVFNNTFRGTDVGLQTQGNNSSLNIRCNTFASDGNPHNVAAWITFGELMQQGIHDATHNCHNNHEYPAGNEWKEPCTGTGEMDIVMDNPDYYFDYYGHWRHAITQLPTTLPECSTDDWLDDGYLHQCNSEKIPGSTGSCGDISPLIPLPPDDPNYITEIDNQIVALNTEQTASRSLIEAGDAQALTDMVYADEPEGHIKNELLNASPYLSDRVMITAIEDKPTPLPPGHVKQVVVANSPVTDPVYDAVLGRSLPPGTMNNINAAQVGVSEREKLKNKINWYDAQIQTLENTKVNYYVESGDMTTAKTLLEASTLAESKKRLAEIYMDEGDYTASRSALVDVIYYSDADEIDNNQAYVDLTTVLLDLYEAGLDIYDMDATQEQVIRDVAETEGSASVQAEVILTVVFNEEFEHPILKLNPATTKNLTDIYRELYNLPDEEPEPVAKLYPNPNDGNMELQYNFEDEQDGKIIIYDNTGKEVLQYDLKADKHHLKISSNKLENGVYIYRITSGGETILEEKLVIIK
ncbi:MAG: T9SS type A sorting domain-containing protein, partial [Bacteroidetes bacterium]|nr:T9SS type A sorting domain-containing protein [Bacteroidota bacterium]